MFVAAAVEVAMENSNWWMISCWYVESVKNKGEGEIEKINELHQQITGQDSMITALHVCIHRSKNSEEWSEKR